MYVGSCAAFDSVGGLVTSAQGEGRTPSPGLSTGLAEGACHALSPSWAGVAGPGVEHRTPCSGRSASPLIDGRSQARSKNFWRSPSDVCQMRCGGAPRHATRRAFWQRLAREAGEKTASAAAAAATARTTLAAPAAQWAGAGSGPAGALGACCAGRTGNVGGCARSANMMPGLLLCAAGSIVAGGRGAARPEGSGGSGGY